ncbi:hypothetical protein KIW84_021199 [Lathyrus oleraceus]|uniref:DUF7745 domain-containing protein n=1 Tax=Pisum sativum TaxID=3888 RepID=A0A9D4Y9G4_PEA|nr:hypothetical protein KIW84_021199 [Pisum sativum]
MSESVAEALHLSVEEVTLGLGPRGFSRKLLEENSRALEKDGKWLPLSFVLALLIYGVVLFSNDDDYTLPSSVQKEERHGIELCFTILHMDLVPHASKGSQKFASLTAEVVNWYLSTSKIDQRTQICYRRLKNLGLKFIIKVKSLVNMIVGLKKRITNGWYKREGYSVNVQTEKERGDNHRLFELVVEEKNALRDESNLEIQKLNISLRDANAKVEVEHRLKEEATRVSYITPQVWRENCHKAELSTLSVKHWRDRFSALKNESLG